LVDTDRYHVADLIGGLTMSFPAQREGSAVELRQPRQPPAECRDCPARR
jgi:hypothetical protein